MTGVPLQTLVEAAEAYESLMVPALFAEWAPNVAAAARTGTGRRVLDVACGTGILGRAAARAGAESVVGLDPNPGMLTVAGRRFPDAEWIEGVAESLPFPDRSFDAVVSQFGLMFFRDRTRALREALRVVRPGGRLVFAVWDVIERNPAYAEEAALLERLAGNRAAEAVRVPFALGDRDTLAALFADAGARSIEIATGRATGRFPGIRTMVEADLRGWLPVMGVMLSEDVIARVLAAAEQALAAYLQADGSVEFETSAHIVTATPA